MIYIELRVKRHHLCKKLTNLWIFWMNNGLKWITNHKEINPQTHCWTLRNPSETICNICHIQHYFHLSPLQCQFHPCKCHHIKNRTNVCQYFLLLLCLDFLQFLHCIRLRDFNSTLAVHNCCLKSFNEKWLQDVVEDHC